MQPRSRSSFENFACSCSIWVTSIGLPLARTFYANSQRTSPGRNRNENIHLPRFRGTSDWNSSVRYNSRSLDSGERTLDGSHHTFEYLPLICH